MKKRLIIIGEKVHDVGYRPFLLGIAKSLGIERFYAENIYLEGRQAIEVLIDTSEDKLNSFIKIVNVRRSSEAVVTRIDIHDYEGNVMDIDSYYKYLTAMQLVKIANIGVQILSRQDTMIEKQDMMIEKQELILKKQDLMIEKQDLMIKKQDELLGKQDQVITEIRSLRDDLKTFLNERLLKLEMEIAKIKAKIGL